jgi:perosamine synthetase
MPRIPVAGPWITQKEIDYVTDAVANCWYSNASKYHERFERAMAEYLGVRFAIALPSCTSALHLSLAALGIGPGDEVIVPDVTWIASAAPVHYVRAEPVFADIDETTWCISPESMEQCLSDRTKAVIVVHLYGGMPNMDRILAVARRRGIAVIEDAAEAFGSKHRGAPAGSLGDAGTFSFHGSKTITTGEGGMLVTNREDVYRRAIVLRDHGREPGDTAFFNTEVAFKYKMSSMQAALGLAQIERANELIARKREIFRWYALLLAGDARVTLNPEPPGVFNSYWMVTAVADPALRVTHRFLIEELSKREIDSRPFFHPLSSLPAYSGSRAARAARQRNRVAYGLAPRGINLPSALNLTESQAVTVCGALQEILAQAARRAAEAA